MVCVNGLSYIDEKRNSRDPRTKMSQPKKMSMNHGNVVYMVARIHKLKLLEKHGNYIM